MTSFTRFESKTVVKKIYIYTHCNLWRHRQFITILYQFLHIRIEIIHGSHMYILFLPRVGLYASFLPVVNARGKTSWHKGLPMVKTIYTYGFHELFLNSNMTSFKRIESKPVVKIIYIYTHCNLWRHRQFITIFYQFLHIIIEIIHGSHMYILFLPRVILYVSFLPVAIVRGKTSWHKGLPVVKTIYTYGFHELFLN